MSTQAFKFRKWISDMLTYISAHAACKLYTNITAHPLTLFRPDTCFGIVCKQCRPCSDAQNVGSDQGLYCLLKKNFYAEYKKI